MYNVRNSATLTLKHCFSPEPRRDWRHLANLLPREQYLRNARRNSKYHFSFQTYQRPLVLFYIYCRL